jgi:hypothetical protein
MPNDLDWQLERRLDRDTEREPHTARQRIPLCAGGALKTHFSAAPPRLPELAHDGCTCEACRRFAAVDWSSEFARSLDRSSQRQAIPVVRDDAGELQPPAKGSL